MENTRKSSYPITGYPRWDYGAGGLLEKVEITPSISIGDFTTSSGKTVVYLFKNGKPLWKCPHANITDKDWDEAIDYDDLGGYVEQERITRHARDVIDWIENGCDPSNFDVESVRSLLNNLFDYTESDKIVRRYIQDSIKSGRINKIIDGIRFDNIKFKEIVLTLNETDKAEIVKNAVKSVIDIDFPDYTTIRDVRVFFDCFGFDNICESINNSDRDVKIKWSSVIIRLFGLFDSGYKEWEWEDEYPKRVNFLKCFFSKIELDEEDIQFIDFDKEIHNFVTILRSQDHVEFDEFLLIEKYVDNAIVIKAKDGNINPHLFNKRAEIANIFPELSDKILSLRDDKEIDLGDTPKGFKCGIEVEQCAKEDVNGDPCSCVSKNSNFLSLPVFLPDAVKQGTVKSDVISKNSNLLREIEKICSSFSTNTKRDTFCIDSNDYDGHFDANGPWEFILSHKGNLDDLIGQFDNLVKGNRWVWHNNWNVKGMNRSCSSHIHFSHSYDWVGLWNFLIQILPLTAPFWIHGQRPRKQAFQEKIWARPVVDLFNHDQFQELIHGNVVKGKSGHHYQYGHQYDVLAWNRHNEKKQLTIEFRLNEAHPYWSVSCLKALQVYYLEHLSIRIENAEEVLADLWDLISKYDVYEALSRSKPIRIVKYVQYSHKNRALRDFYANALEFFVDFCRILQSYVERENEKDERNMKVLELYENLVDTGKIDANHIWDIDSLYAILKDIPDIFNEQCAYHFP